MTITPTWVALDWGSTHARAYAMGADDAVLQERHADVASLGADKSAALQALLGDWQVAEADVIACGMIGAREGLLPAPYRAVPCTPLGSSFATLDLPFAGQLHVVAGLSQAAPADVMRGEETQAAGWLRAAPNWDGVLCLPGTHTKWVQASAGEVVSFRSFMTGEIFGLLSKQSVLRHSVDGVWDETAFLEAVSASYSRPEQLAARLFGIRAGDLVGQGGGGAPALSGILLGAELAAAKPWWLGQDIILIGDEGLSQLYLQALKALGASARLAPAKETTLAGLIAARRLLQEGSSK